MSNLFGGLSSGTTSLKYYSRSIETAGHNLANADTDGYSRQRVNASEAPALSVGNGLAVGQGVAIDSITRIRDEFLDAQYRKEVAKLGYWDTRLRCITNLEYYSGSIAANNLGNAIDGFWDKMQELSLSPDKSTYRESLVESAKTMVSQLIDIRDEYDKYRSDLNEQIANYVDEANKLIDDIAEITNEIFERQSVGEQPNDLLDRRDLMAERLCELTGAHVNESSHDGTYKIDLNGKYLIWGGAEYNCKGTRIKNTRHLELVPMKGNSNYYDVQVEHDIFQHSSDYNVASVIMERQSVMPSCANPTESHDLFVERLSNGKIWQVGGALGTLAGGERLDTIYSATEALGINGSFGLSVGSSGVRAISASYVDDQHPDMNGVIKRFVPGDTSVYEFRISAGEFERTIRAEFVNDIDDGAGGKTDGWRITVDGRGNAETLLGEKAGKDLTVESMAEALNKIQDLTATFDPIEQRFTVEAANTNEMRGHLLSIVDTRNGLAGEMGIAVEHPSVEITVTEDDTLTTIANKINGAYKTTLASGDAAAYTTNPPGEVPDEPEEWLHANIITEPNGSKYILLTSNVAGEANRINVLPGSVCGANGDFSVARLLGFTDAGSEMTSYMQLNTDPRAGTTIDKDDVYVDDAYFIFDGVHYLSDSNSFGDARAFKTTNASGEVIRWNDPKAETLDDFYTGLRLNLNGLNRFYDETGLPSQNAEATIIKSSSHVKTGSIYAMLECRDDMILAMIDQLDRLAYEMQTEVNAVHYASHGTGDNKDTTGVSFFRENMTTLHDASRKLRVNENLAVDISLIGTGADDGTGHSRGEGDGYMAILSSQLKTTKVFNSGVDDFNTYYQSFVGNYGTQGYEARNMLSAQQSIIDQIDSERDSVMGVSSDEEMLDIIRFQQGMNAVSRYMTALDDLLDRIINGMGRVGL